MAASYVSAKPDLVLTRIFDAPRDLVFKAWTEPERLKRWWGPKVFTTPVCKLDLRPGGAIRIDMRGPDGTIYPMTGVFQEIVEPERLVYTGAALNAQGEAFFEGLHTVEFEEHGGKTKLTLTVRILMTTPEAAVPLAGMEQGWSQSLDKLRLLIT